MEKAKVAIFEDNESLRALYTQHLLTSEQGHVVAAEAGTLSESYDVLDQIDAGYLEVDAIILDGNLSPNDTSGNDAREIVKRVKKLPNRPIIFGMSAEPMEKYGIEVDRDISKRELAQAMGRIVSYLDKI
jgi:CheY-like chemotaxis protein